MTCDDVGSTGVCVGGCCCTAPSPSALLREVWSVRVVDDVGSVSVLFFCVSCGEGDNTRSRHGNITTNRKQK